MILIKSKSLQPLAFFFALGGVWDTIAGILYIFVIGSGRNIDNPPMDPFYSIFLGSFFLCFAYLQFMSALNIRRYAFNVGCLIIGRVFYIVLLYSYMVFIPGFPDTFRFTGIIDGLLTISYLIFALQGGLSLKDLFLPEIERS
ncbi:MAG: hypothetical protein AB9834_17645 [Lentimicrobium sp.]